MGSLPADRYTVPLQVAGLDAMTRLITAFISLLLVFPLVALASPEGQPDAAQAEKTLQDARLRALRKVFREKPGSQQVLESAVGYAVLVRVGLNAGLASSAHIGGILRHNRSGRDSYFRVEPATGYEGVFIEDLSMILVFQNAEAFGRFAAGDWLVPSLADAEVEDLAGASLLTAAPDTAAYILAGNPPVGWTARALPAN